MLSFVDSVLSLLSAAKMVLPQPTVFHSKARVEAYLRVSRPARGGCAFVYFGFSSTRTGGIGDITVEVLAGRVCLFASVYQQVRLRTLRTETCATDCKPRLYFVYYTIWDCTTILQRSDGK